MAVALAACGGAGRTTPPAASASPSSAPATTAAIATASAVAAQSVAVAASPYSAKAFNEPFTITLPAGWLIGDQSPDMFSFYLPMGPQQGPRLGIDVQEVSKVFGDPCAHNPAEIDAGTSPEDLAAWMDSWAPLNASKPVAGTVSGIPAVVVEEAFEGTAACPDANLWATPGSYLDPQEHKRYSIVTVGEKRLVVTLVGRDDTWDSTLADGQKVLDSLVFTNP